MPGDTHFPGRVAISSRASATSREAQKVVAFGDMGDYLSGIDPRWIGSGTGFDLCIDHVKG